jgi:hypothetical protein
MGMSGKTFLSAFQMGAKIYPDIVQSREDQIDRELKRGVIDLQKKKMETDRDIAATLRDREVIGMTSLNNLQTGYAALDMDDPKFPSRWRKLVKDNITGIGMSKRSLEGFNTIKSTVIGNEAFKAREVAETEAWVAGAWWNENNAFNKITPESPPELLKEAGDAYKKHLQEEKNKVTRADVVATAGARVGVADEAKFKAFVEETGSPYKAGDYAKPEAKNAMRIHNQLGEVKELLMEVGEEGLPIASKLAIRSDGSGYKNLLEVKTELVTLNNKLKEQRGSKGKSLSEAQGNAFAYSERMRANNRVIDQMEVKGLVPENDILNGLLVSWGKNNDVDFWNVVVDPEYQQFKSAADNFIRATLRKESGAAISEAEYKGAFRDYIPRIGDSPGLVKQKRRLRIGVANVMRRQSGMAWDSGDEFPLAPFQFNDLDQAKKYAALGYVEDGDEVLIKSGDSWATHKLNSKKKTIATP